MNQGVKKRVTLALAVMIGMTGCAQTVPQRQAEESGAPNAPATRRWAVEDAPTVLRMGLHFYEQADYGRAEYHLRDALSLGLTEQSDRLRAYKFLAFIQCASGREDECRASFTAALKVDPRFSLSRSEAGHPMWGPVFKELRAGQRQQ